MKTLSEIRPIKQAREADLLKRPGVTGVDIGYKYVGGEKTDVRAIRVYVAEKKDPKDVPKDDMIPKTMKGVKTDVIQRKFVLHPLRLRVADLELKADTGTYDPLKGGISIGPCRSVWLEPPDVPSAGWYIFVGTLGAIVTDNASGDPMLLSNFHVMCVDDGWSVGDTMAQPSRLDGGSCPADVVGALQRASLGGQVDCAVASHTARGYACEIVEIGEVTGTATATPDMAVRKRGRTTGLTYGTVDTVDLTVPIDYGDGLGEVTLTRQIGIEVDPAQSAQFGDNGDSGSVVVNDEGKVVGLHFAGNEDGTYGVANPIQAVLDALNVSICVPSERAAAFQYTVKFVCGESEGDVVAPGRYFTAINVHNPTEKPINFRKRFAIALPGERPGPVSEFFDARLSPNQALEIDCEDIFKHTQSTARFLKGFAVVESDVELDVVAVYTAAGATKLVETLQIERVPPRRLIAGLPDLVPVPDPEPGIGFCRLDNQGRLVVTVKNQGNAEAPASTTMVEFFPGGSFPLPTPPIPAGGSVNLPPLDMPAACYNPDCNFRITVDANNEIDESDKSNNSASGICLG